jgi:hypothetical protein
VKAWLVERGFKAVDWGEDTVFQRVHLESIFGLEKEIEVSVTAEAGEVTEVYSRFTLPRCNPPPLNDWAEFAMELCNRFRLRLGAEGVVPCSEAEFLAAVRDNCFYRKFAASFGWDAGIV